jgi:hypothetical protein
LIRGCLDFQVRKLTSITKSERFCVARVAYTIV